jgi:hypothetical protein
MGNRCPGQNLKECGVVSLRGRQEHSSSGRSENGNVTRIEIMEI